MTIHCSSYRNRSLSLFQSISVNLIIIDIKLEFLTGGIFSYHEWKNVLINIWCKLNQVTKHWILIYIFWKEEFIYRIIWIRDRIESIRLIFPRKAHRRVDWVRELGARQLPSDLAAIYGVSRNSYRSLVPCQWWPPIFHNSTPHNPRLYRWIRGARMRNIETRPTIYCRLRVKQGNSLAPLDRTL